MSDIRKRYQYKVYSATGQYITTWTDVVNDPSFHVVINGGFVELDCKLARKTVDFGENSDVLFGNEVQVWCYDADAPAGVKIFSGYISRYDPRNDGPQEYVMVYCLGYHTLMNQFMHEDSVGSTNIAYLSVDPGEIAEDIINKARIAGLPVNWNETTLQKTGTVVSYTFQANMVQECIDKCLELTPFGWYWYVDADKLLNMHPKSEQAKHTFTIGKEIFYIEPQKRIENVINRVYFIGGIPNGATDALYGRYERQASIQNYGLRSVKKTDQRVTLQSTMDTICANILDSQDEIEIRTVIRVKDNDYDRDNGYDIESIKVGDTCQIRNYQDAFSASKWDVMSWDTDFWDYNVRNLTEIVMQIVEIQYQPNNVELTISSKIPNVSKRIEDINRTLVDSIVVDAPADPVLGTT